MKSSSVPSNTDSNRSELARQLNLSHPLVQLSKSLDWPLIEDKFGRTCKPNGGRPPLPARLMVGLHYLKALYDESDESVVAKWVENPYWQYFCGEVVFQHELPCHPTSLVKWRKQVGPEGIEQLLGQVIRSAMRTALLKPREIERVNVDTTVQEKAVAFFRPMQDFINKRERHWYVPQKRETSSYVKAMSVLASTPSLSRVVTGLRAS